MSESYNHFTLSDRIELERMLSVSSTVSAIGETLGFSRQSVIREIMRNRTDEGRAKVYGKHWNGCVHQRRCTLRHVCDWRECDRRCAVCRNVNCVANCKSFEASSCPSLLRPPYVCNGCPQYKSCAYPRLAYHAELAQARAQELLVSCRCGIDHTEDELALIISVVKPLLDNGLSPAVIWTEHGDRLPCSERSFYRYVTGGAIRDIIRMDLPAAVGYKQRRTDHGSSRANLSAEALAGRTQGGRFSCVLQLLLTLLSREVHRQAPAQRRVTVLFLKPMPCPMTASRNQAAPAGVF
jgi:hypothetical protein